MVAIAKSELQGFSARVDGYESKYQVANVATKIACIDAKKSEIDWWPENPRRPDRKGKARAIFKLVLDPERASGRHVFRLAEAGDIIVSNVLKNTLEQAKVTGIKFSVVCE